MMNRKILWSVVAAAAVLLLAAGGFVLLSDPGGGQNSSQQLAGHDVAHETSGRQPEQLSVPTTVSEAAWTWEGPEDSALLEILPVPTGAVLHMRDGAVGLDTRTGEEVWSYRLLEAEADVVVSPDGSLVAVSAGGSLTLLVSGTGEEVRTVEHGETEAGHLSLGGAGLVADEGLITAGSSGSEGVVVSLDPWEDEPGWRNEDLECVNGSGTPQVDQGFLAPSGVVVVYRCGAGEPVLVSLDTATGEVRWSLVQGQDFNGDFEYHDAPEEVTFAPVGDVAVLQNMASLRGTVVIGTEDGEVLSDSLPSENENYVLRILPDGYLVVRTEDLGDGEWEVRFEVRSFSGEVRETVVTDDESLSSTLTGQLVLEGSLLKLRWSEQEGNMEIAVFDWSSENQETAITLPVEIDLSEVLSVSRSEQLVGPGTFQAAPGAVLLREYPGSGTARVVGLT
jgi:outer membrane protein assembly factor BamB